LFSPWAHAGQPLTLEQCLQKGVEHNPSLQASRFKTDAAGRDVKSARADFLPALSSSFSANRIDSAYAKGPTETDYIDQEIHSANIKLTQILYAGSRIVNTHEKAQLVELATQAETQLVQLELAYNIETTFYKVMKAKQDVIVSSEAVERLRASVQAAEAFYRKELVPYVDVLKARVDLADADNQLSIAKNNENRQRVALFSLMNLPLDPETDFVGEDAVIIGERPPFDVCFDAAVEHRPDLKTLEYQRQAADKQAAVALGKYLPVVRVEAGYYDQDNDYLNLGNTGYSTYDRDQTNQYWAVGLTVSWDLFDGGRSWYESEKNDLESLRFGALLKEANNTIATGIRKALYSMGEAEQRLTSSTGALTAAQENYTAEDNRLKAGVSTMTNLLDAQSRLVRAQVNRSNATLDYQLAKSELKLMTGGKKSW
jgi:outer membrane protein TolC